MLLKTFVFNWGVHQHLPHLARILVTSLAFFFSWQRCAFRHWRRRWKEDRRRWQNQLRSQVCVINELPKLVVLFLTRSTLKRKNSFSCSCSLFVIGISHQDLVGCYLQTERICWICGLSLIILRYIHHWPNVFLESHWARNGVYFVWYCLAPD